MATVLYYDATGKKVGEEIFAQRRDAQQAARQYVSRNGLNTYRTRREAQTEQTRYYHSYGEREALVRW